MSVSTLTLNLVEGSVSFSFSEQAARDLQSAIALLMESLKAVAAKPTGGKTVPEKPMEYQYAGEVFFEVFCNPNIWPTPFAAKVLIAVRDDRIRVTAEAELSRLREDLGQYLDRVG
ncbi:MAG: hypothetical protein HC849_07690 [Oscillatoriales cyanobacterium RU_3_3]|nr:hypothetical protein [Microcoleus sp. SU_5_6]NJM60085.1 hypothetical protein [Oscillatoriales cyanobacterium RU_3_3]